MWDVVSQRAIVLFRPFRAGDFVFLDLPGALPRAVLSHPFGVKNHDVVPDLFLESQSGSYFVSVPTSFAPPNESNQTARSIESGDFAILLLGRVGHFHRVSAPS